MAAGALQGNVCPGLGVQGNYGHGRGHAADAGRVRPSPGLRSLHSALVPRQQLQRHGRERPCAKGKMTAGVGRALPESMMRGLSQFRVYLRMPSFAMTSR